MRNLLILLVMSVCLLSTGCSTNDESIYLTPVTDATLSAYGTVGVPVKTKLDAVIVARINMQGPRIASVGDPQVIYAEQISLAEASQKLGYNPAAFHPDNMRVWLVIFESEWQLVFPMPDEQGVFPTSEPPSHGCKFSLIRASDGHDLAIISSSLRLVGESGIR
jgi:hypothetical protein